MAHAWTPADTAAASTGPVSPAPVPGATAPAAATSVPARAHDIIIPPIPCSFSWRNHPDYQQLTLMSADSWLHTQLTNLRGADGRLSSFAADLLIQSGFQMLTTLVFANGISERMPPIIKMMNWMFIIDNLLDDPSEMGADPARADQMINSLLTVFHDTYDRPSPSPSPLVCILTDITAEWWAEISKEMPPKQKARLSKACCEYLETNRLQVLSNRNSCQLPDVESYLKIRAYNVGWWPFAVLIEHSQGFELDDETLSHPLLRALQENTVQHILLVNDVISFKKECMQGDFFNIVPLLYFRKLNNFSGDLNTPTLTWQGAMLEALEMIKDRDNKCVRLIAKIRKCTKLMRRSGMEQYLEGIGLWISGNLYWHLVSARYGICASIDLHNIPPDMHAHYHLSIDTSNGSPDFILQGGMMQDTY